LVEKICLPISFQGSPLALTQLVCGFLKKAQESDELARKWFFRRIFGILWVSSITDFNLYFEFPLLFLNERMLFSIHPPSF